MNFTRNRFRQTAIFSLFTVFMATGFLPENAYSAGDAPANPVLQQPAYSYPPNSTTKTSVPVSWYMQSNKGGTHWFVLDNGLDTGNVIYTSASGNYTSGSTNLNPADGGHTITVALCNSDSYAKGDPNCSLSNTVTTRVGPDANYPPTPASALNSYLYGSDVTKLSWRFYTPADKPASGSNTAQFWNIVVYTNSPSAPVLVSPDYTTFSPMTTGYMQESPATYSFDISSLPNGTYKAMVQLCNKHSPQNLCIDNRDGPTGSNTAGGPVTFTVSNSVPYFKPNPTSLTMSTLNFTDDTKRTVSTTLTAEWTTTPVHKGDYWKLTDDANGSQSTVTKDATNPKDDANHQTIALNLQLSGAGKHTITAYLCNGNHGAQDVCADKTASGTIDLPALPVPGKPEIDSAKVNNPQNGQLATLTWLVKATDAQPKPVGGSLWQLRDSSSDGDTSSSTLVASYTVPSGDPGTSASVSNVSISNGDHYLFIVLCNADNVCTTGPTYAVQTSGATVRPVITAYYSDWGTYNPYLRHGSTDPGAPYGFSKVQYQDCRNNILTMNQNTDADSAVKNLDIIYYAFMEPYPANSVSWNPVAGTKGKCRWVQYKTPETSPPYPYNPTDSSDKQYANNGTIFFFDPWSDIYAVNNPPSVDQMCDYNTIKNETPANGVEGPLHILCLAGYETGPQWVAKHRPIPISIPDQDTYLWYFRFGNFAKFVTQQNHCDPSKSDPNCPRLKHLIAIGGWAHDDGFEAGAFVNPQNFADSIVNLMKLVSNISKTASLDGVDLDYEPNRMCNGVLQRYTPEHAVDLIKLATTLRTTFDKNPDKNYPNDRKIITAAMYANPSELKDFDNNKGDCTQPDQCNLRKYAAQLDYISMMGYDFHGPWDAVGSESFALPQSNLYDSNVADNPYNVEAAVQTLLDAKVPANKIIVGVPSYARVDTGVTEGDSHGRNQPFAEQKVPVAGSEVSNPIYNGDLDNAKDPTVAQGQQSYYSLVHTANGYNPTNCGTPYTSQPWLGNYGFNSNPYPYLSNGILSETWLYSPQTPPNPSGINQAKTDTNKGVFVTYDTVDLVDTKADYVLKNGLGGMMMWEMMSDTAPKPGNTDHSLLCEMYKKLHPIPNKDECQY